MNPTALIILDGFGFNPYYDSNAIAQANAPFFNFCLQHYPHTTLLCSGSSVGLLPNQAGNSEVGHLTIGAGRLIEQDVVRLHKIIDDGSFYENPMLLTNLKKLAENNKALHIMGLLSDAGVHSHEKHLYAFLKAATSANIKHIIVHAFTDGRDTPPRSAETYLTHLDEYLKQNPQIQLGSIIGRFYAMDRDNNWNRTEQAYQCLTHSMEFTFKDWQSTLNYYYKKGIFDEFIPPTQLNANALVKSGDGIIFFNFRPDRARQLTAAFTQSHFDKFPVRKINLAFFITPTHYEDIRIKTTNLLPKLEINNTLKDILSNAKKTIFSLAETEKYAHVTYFFDGMKEELLPCEERTMIQSIVTTSYAAYPCMSAPEITDTILNSIRADPKDFYLVNYANADMVGHSGNLAATIKAVECLDEQLKTLYEDIVLAKNGTIYITGDHGNAEEMQDLQTGQLKTSHTKNSVYFIMLRKDLEDKHLELPLKSLKDIAPFILKQMKIAIPKEMAMK